MEELSGASDDIESVGKAKTFLELLMSGEVDYGQDDTELEKLEQEADFNS